jgi:hypothetical protein
MPGVAELLRPAAPLPAVTDDRQVTGRERHDQKITVYLSAAELLDLEHARLSLRRLGFMVDRGRLVREAIAILLADLDARGPGSLIARRIRASQREGDPGGAPAVNQPGLHGQPGLQGTRGHEDSGDEGGSDIPQDTVPSLTWGQLLVAR